MGSELSEANTDPAGETPAADASTRPASRHWRGRIKAIPMPQEQAARQGNITQEAFLLLGKEQAIAFLNTDNPTLGGRPIALATESAEGQALVRAELQRLSETVQR